MKRATTTLLAIVLAVLVMSTPVAADHTTLLASQHTTDTDFSAGTLAGNTTIDGTGTAASVVVEDPIVDSFEDTDLSEYPDTNSSQYLITSANPAVNGQYYLLSSSTPPGTIASTPGDGLDNYYGRGDGNYTAYVQLSSSTRARVGTLAKNATHFYGVKLQPDLIEIGPYWPTSVCNPDCTGDIVTTNVPTNEWLRVVIQQDTDTARVWVYDANDNLLAELSDSRNSEFDSYRGVAWGANDTGVQFDYAHRSDVQNGVVDGEYTSQNHTVAAPAEGYTNLSIAAGGSATVVWEGSNGGAWQPVASASYTTDGNRSLAFNDTSYQDYRVRVTLAGVGTALHDEGVYAENRDPTVSNLSPADGASVSSPVTLEADIADVNLQQGESVTVNFTLDGSVIDTQTIASNQTVSTSTTVDPDRHTWQVSAEDATHTTTSAQRSFTVPGYLHVYNESDPDTLITDSVNVTFYGTDGFVDSKTTTTGTVSLAGLADNQTYTARARSDAYVTRTLFIDNLATNHSVYLLPTANTTTADIIFKLDDNTGDFPPGTTELEIQRALTKSGTTRYRTITSDVFGAANEYPVELEQDVRYRLVVTNADGQTRVLGPYTVTGDDPDAVLPIGEVQAVGNTDDDVAFAASLTEDSGQRAVVMTYRDRADATTDLYLNVTNRETGASLRANTSVSGPFGVYQETVLVPGGAPDDVSYRVEYHAARDGEPSRNGTRIVGDIPESIGVFELGSNVLFLLASAIVIAVTGAVALYSASAAAIVAPALATAFTLLGALSIPLPLLAGAGAIGVLAAAGGAIR